VFEVWKLCIFFRQSLRSYERNSISSYFDKLLETNTVGACGIPLLQVLLGIILNFSASFLSVMFTLEYTFLLFMYPFSPVTHASPSYKGGHESCWPMVNRLKLQSIQMHREYYFAALRCELVD
jgi:hypothetical protein